MRSNSAFAPVQVGQLHLHQSAAFADGLHEFRSNRARQTSSRVDQLKATQKYTKAGAVEELPELRQRFGTKWVVEVAERSQSLLLQDTIKDAGKAVVTHGTVVNHELLDDVLAQFQLLWWTDVLRLIL